MNTKDLPFWVFMLGVLVSCSKNPCDQLRESVCSKVAGTPACERAQRTSNKDQCAGFLKDVDKFIALANEQVETPPLQPPKREPVTTEQKDAAAVTDSGESQDITSVSPADGAKTHAPSTETP